MKKIPEKPKESLWFIFKNQQLLLTDKMEIPKSSHRFIKNAQFLMQLPLDHTHFSHYVAEIGPDAVLPAEMRLKDLKEAYHFLPSDIIALAGKAYQLIEWDKSHRYCGGCGSQTQISNHEHTRICTNASCKRIFFPRISPVVIVAVERNQEILLARSPHFPPDIYSVLAGFVEAGENIENAVHREVYEETGIKIKNLRYFKSQPWPFPHSLMLGFQADYESGDIICDMNEIEDAAFFHVDRLPKIFPGNFTLSQWLIHDFRKRHEQNG